MSELTWSQRGIWELQHQIWPEHHYFNSARLLSAPRGSTLTDVEDAFRWLVETYEAFRTTVRRDPGGVPRQHVTAVGQYPLDLHEVGAADPASVAGRLAREYRGHAFADEEWPLRAAVVTCAGAPAYVLLTASHLAVDRWGMRVACAALADRLAARAGQPPPPAGAKATRQPVDQAEAEASPAGRRLAEQAARYWRRGLRAIPQTMFPYEPAQAADRWCLTGELRTSAAALAADALATRHGTPAPVVILAATAALLGLRTGNMTVAMRLLASNRHEAEVREMVGTCVQPALFAVDLGDISFHELIVRSRQSAAAAYRHARYPAPLIDEITHEINVCRGISADLLCHFRDGTDATTRMAGPVWDVGEIAAARSRSRFRSGALFGARQKFVLEVSGRLGAELRLFLAADRGYLSLADVRTLVHGIETVLIEAVRRDFCLAEAARLTGVAPVGRSPTAVRVDRCWVEPAAVARLLGEVPGVVAAQAEVVGGQDGCRLVGRVAVQDASLDTARLHQEVIRRLRGRPAAMAPQYYLIHLAEGQALADPGALPLCCEGPGREVYNP